MVLIETWTRHQEGCVGSAAPQPISPHNCFVLSCLISSHNAPVDFFSRLKWCCWYCCLVLFFLLMMFSPQTYTTSRHHHVNVRTCIKYRNKCNTLVFISILILILRTYIYITEWECMLVGTFSCINKKVNGKREKEGELRRYIRWKSTSTVWEWMLNPMRDKK